MKSIFSIEKNNSVSAIYDLLYLLEVKVNFGTLDEKLTSHPEFPSLLAISDCLDELNVRHQSFKIEKTEYDAEELLFPFVAHFSARGGSFVLVHSIKAGLVQISNEKRKKINITEAQFLKEWSGIALHAEADANSGEKDYSQKRLKYALTELVFPLLCYLILTTLYLTFFKNTFNWSHLFLMIVKLAGSVVSVLLLVQSIDSNNPFIQNLCSLGGKNDCNEILKSDAAKISSWLNWSEVGFFYFTGTLLISLFLSVDSGIIIWLNLLALPYTVYSISYQYKAKNWCILCCTIQALLWLEFSILISSGFFLKIDTGSIFLSLVCLMTPIILWAFLKPFFLSAVQLKPVLQQLKKFKYNSELFNKALIGQPRYAIGKDLTSVILGNSEAQTIITMISNPFCAPCAKTHRVIEEWLKVQDDLQLKVIFMTANHDNDIRTKVARHITALGFLENKDKMSSALNDWYTSRTKNYEDWSLKYPVTFNEEISSITEKQSQWCKMAEITFTPTILINGYKLPEPYRLEDLKYLLN